MFDRRQTRVLFVLVAVLLVTVEPASVYNKRAIQSGEEPETRLCHPLTPCGWAVYTPFSRRVDYFMQNACVCETGKECLKTDDDLSANAYVYKCRDRTPEDSDSLPPS